MKDWTKEELDVLNKITTVQNHPNDDEGQSFQDSSICVVTNNNHVYLRELVKAKKANVTSRVKKNGGAIEFNNQTYPVNYVAVEDEDEIKAVTDAYEAKYHGQYPIDMMVSDKCATATVRLDLQ